MKKFKFFLVFLVICILVTGTVWSAKAFTGRQAYGSVYHGCVNHTNPIKDKGWITITRNNDYPVDNYLYARIRAQYKKNNDYIWTDWVSDSGENREKADVSIWHYSIYCTEAYVSASAAGCNPYSETIYDLCQ